MGLKKIFGILKVACHRIGPCIFDLEDSVHFNHYGDAFTNDLSGESEDRVFSSFFHTLLDGKRLKRNGCFYERSASFKNLHFPPVVSCLHCCE